MRRSSDLRPKTRHLSAFRAFCRHALNRCLRWRRPDDHFLSPWPASALGNNPPCEVGLRGTSLTGIDAAVAIALEHGAFIEDGERLLTYRPNSDAGGFRLTMMSCKGLLPEADFFHPIPYEPLSICTEAAIDSLLVSDDINLIEDAFSLFKAELVAADPEYAIRIGAPTWSWKSLRIASLPSGSPPILSTGPE